MVYTIITFLIIRALFLNCKMYTGHDTLTYYD